MSDPSEDTRVMLDHSFAEDLVSRADAGRENDEYASADVLYDLDSASRFVLKVWVYSECSLEVRPRDDDGCAVVLRIRGDDVRGPVEVEVPACCLLAERGSGAEDEERDRPGKAASRLTSFAHVRASNGEYVDARVVRDDESRSGLALDVSLACGRTVMVRPGDDEAKLVALRLSGGDEQPAGRVVEVEIPKHVMTRGLATSSLAGTPVHR